MQRADGLVTFECKHNGCQGLHWRDFRDRVGIPDPERHYDPPFNSAAGKAKSAGTAAPPEGQEAEAAEVTPPTFTTSLMTSAEFDQAAYHQEFLDPRRVGRGATLRRWRPVEDVCKTTLIGDRHGRQPRQRHTVSRLLRHEALPRRVLVR
jgi:hypothetical protein